MNRLSYYTHVVFTMLVFGMGIHSTAQSAPSNETVIFYVTDLLGSQVAAFEDAPGSVTVLWKQGYQAFGEREIDSIPTSPALSEDSSHGYTGHSTDVDTGLVYMGDRWYSPDIGRFMSVDPEPLDINNHLTYGRYIYANNNPYRYIDPDGRSPVDIAFLMYDGYNLTEAFLSGDGIGDAAFNFGASVIGVVSPIPLIGQLIKAKKLAKVAKGGGKASNKAPDFVVSPGGTAFPVPKGAKGPTSVVNPGGKATGSAFTGGKGGTNGQVDTMRIMNPTPARGKSPGYPNGYIKYENKAGQGVDPYTGRTISNKKSHFPID